MKRTWWIVSLLGLLVLTGALAGTFAAAHSAPSKIIAFGDSTVHGLQDSSGVSVYNQTWPYLLLVRLGETSPIQDFTNVFSTPTGDNTLYGNDFRIVPESFIGARYTMINSGVNADDTEQMQARLQADVLDRSPDYVIIMGGTNDREARGGYGEWAAERSAARVLAMADSVTDAGSVPILVTIPAWGTDADRAWVKKFNSALVAGGEARGLHVAGVYAALCGRAGYKKNGMAIADGIHFSPLGNRVCAGAFDPSWFGYNTPSGLWHGVTAVFSRASQKATSVLGAVVTR